MKIFFIFGIFSSFLNSIEPQEQKEDKNKPPSIDFSQSWPSEFNIPLPNHEELIQVLISNKDIWWNDTEEGETTCVISFLYERRSHFFSFYPSFFKDENLVLSQAINRTKITNISVFPATPKGQRKIIKVYSKPPSSLQNELTLVTHYPEHYLCGLQRFEGTLIARPREQDNSKDEPLEEWVNQTYINLPLIKCSLDNDLIRKLRPLKNQAYDAALKLYEQGFIKLNNLQILPNDLKRELPEDIKSALSSNI